MRWHTAISHTTKIPPNVTVATFPNPEVEPEVKIDVRGGGLYLTLAEARQLGADLLAATCTQDAVTLTVKAEALDEFAALLRDRYPEDVFPKPSKDDYANLHVALKATGVTLDRISADMLRRAGAQAEREATEIRAIAAESEVTS